MKKYLVYGLILSVLFLIGCNNEANVSSSSKNLVEVNKVDKMLPLDLPNRGLVIDEVRDGHISSKDVDIYLFMDGRFKYYENKDGQYIVEKHDPIVIRETISKFGLSEEIVDKAHYQVGKLLSGLKPQESISLTESGIPVDISIDKVELTSNKELEVTLTNRTLIDSQLPTINLSFQLYKGDQNVGFQVVWAENLTRGTSTYRSLDISDDFDSVDCTAYININDMQNNNLKSKLQSSNDRGETVIPVYKLKKISVK